MRNTAGILASLLAATAFSGANAADKASPEGLAFFESKIRPVLVKHCYQCHSAQVKKPKGGLLLDTKAGTLKGGETGHAVVPGNLKDSLLLAAIKRTGDVSDMPPEVAKLPDSVIADFEKWIKMGAPDPRDGKTKLAGPRKIDFQAARNFWAFQSPRKQPVPPVKNRGWATSDIDRFLLAKMESQGIDPVADADRATLIRRATFDLTGLPPTPQEVAAFVNDSSPNAFEKVVDRLLASKRFGERWGRHWLDVVRYAESTGKERNYAYPYAWRYRNYVIDSFNADKSYDRFLREQFAGDLLPAKTSEQRNEQLIATGLLALGPKSVQGNPLKLHMDVVDDQIDVTGQAVLGLTLACARCHDHKFDPFPTTDYYALAGIFRGTQVLAGIQGRRARADNGSGLISLRSGKAGANSENHEEKLQEARQRLRRAVTQLARRGGAKLNAKKKARKINKKQLQRLLNRMQEPVILESDSPQVVKLKKEVQQAIRDLKKLEKDAPPAAAMAMGVKDAGRPVNSPVFNKGEVNDQGPTVPRGYVTVIWQPEKPAMPADHSGRLQLAQWLTSTKNPLTARVMVNRIWQHLFGSGLVASVNNFGQLGGRPSHPELLDFLAVDFMENGWSVKKAIKKQMLSRAYRLSSAHVERNYTVDPENRFVWRGGRRRLDAEAIRDAILAVSGELDVQRPESSPLQNIGQGEIGRQLQAPSAGGSKRRSVYLPVVRQAMPEMMRVFDVADPSLIVGERDVTTVPTQALFMMNNPFVIGQSAATAKRLFKDKGMDDAGRVAYAYQLALGRKPTKSESDRVLKFLRGTGSEQQDWATFCQTLFASAEFRYLY